MVLVLIYMRIEDGYIVINTGEDWSVLGSVIPGDQHKLPLDRNWGTYPSYAHGAEYKAIAPFCVRRALSQCSAELLAKAGYGAESMHFL